MLFLKETDFVLTEILCLLFAFPGKNKMSVETFSWEIRKRKSPHLLIGFLYPISEKCCMIMPLSRGCSGVRLLLHCLSSQHGLSQQCWFVQGLVHVVMVVSSFRSGGNIPNTGGKQPTWAGRRASWMDGGAQRRLWLVYSQTWFAWSLTCIPKALMQLRCSEMIQRERKWFTARFQKPRALLS